MTTAEQLHIAFFAAKGEPAPPMSYLVRMRRAEQAHAFDRSYGHLAKRLYLCWHVRQFAGGWDNLSLAKQIFWHRVAKCYARLDRSEQEGVAA